MKRLVLVTLLLIAVATAFGQPVTYLQEDFNVACATGISPYPSGWLKYNPIFATNALGSWHCSAYNGRPDLTGNPTSGMDCTGYYSGSAHLDTSYLVTPLIDISGYTGNIYLHFDTKSEIVHPGGKLSVLLTYPSDTGGYNPYAPYADLTVSLMPLFGNDDVTDWVTHEADLTPYKDTFYIAFRYVSSDTSAMIWHLDNVNTSITGLSVTNISSKKLPLGVLRSTASSITLSCDMPHDGTYRLVLCDIMGRTLYEEVIVGAKGAHTYTISGLALRPGMYFVKMGDNNIFGATKVMIY
jgi:hypothetical protein